MKHEFENVSVLNEVILIQQMRPARISYPMPTESLVWASGPSPDTMIIAESGTAPSRGTTIPPEKKNEIFHKRYPNHLLQYQGFH